jgi:hypothetical protein
MSPLLSLSFYGNKDLWQLIELSNHKLDRGILSLSYPLLQLRMLNQEWVLIADDT